MRRRCSTESSTERWFQAPRRGRLLAGERRGRRHRASTPTSARTSRLPCCTRCASSSPGAKGAPTSRWPISSRRARAALADYIGAFMVTAGIGEDDGRRPLQACQRRLLGDHGQGAGRPPGGSVRRAAASARAPGVLGLCAGRGARRRDLIAEKYQRHPPGAGLSGAARPHREGDAVRAARRRTADRRQAHRELRDVAGRVGLRALFQPSARATISASARSSATRSRIMPRRKGWSVAEAERWLAPDPQLRSAGDGEHRGGVAALARHTRAQMQTPESGALRCVKRSRDVAWFVDTPNSKCAQQIAPTNANTANTASTLSLKARSTLRPPWTSRD